MTISTPSLVSTAEKSAATEYLIRTNEQLVAAVKDCSGPDWYFKPSSQEWSVLDVLEHVVIIERMAQGVVRRMGDAPEAGDRPGMDEIIIAEIPIRSSKIQAPPPAHPTGKFPPEQVLQQFAEVRQQTLDLVESAPFLRGRAIPHPVFGPWDGYQWILGVAGHSARHTSQIMEIKAHAGYPRTGGLQ